MLLTARQPPKHFTPKHMPRNRHFKQRQSNRLHYMILQEQAEIEAQRLRDENEQAAATLKNQLAALEAKTPSDTREVRNR